jgi:tRNA(Ile)-lysidine synthase
MIEAVAQFIHQHALLKPGERLGIAVSGGADSVALLRIMLELRGELGIVLAVVHLNHKIRGTESDGDEQFVRELAGKFGLRFLGGSADVPEFARKHGMGLEASARKLRYEYFGTLLQKQADGAASTLDKIATAHTQNDQAETVLMRLLRGAGTRGLSGIHTSLAVASPPERMTSEAGNRLASGTHRIIRPLLTMTRDRITAHLRSLNQPWREDSSNRILEHTRNRIRHELLPMLEQKFNPAIIRVLAEHAEIAQAEEEFWCAQAEQVSLTMGGRDALQVDLMLKLPVALQRRVIRAAAERQGLTLDFEHIEAVRHLINSQPGLKLKRIALPGGTAEQITRGGVGELILRPGSLTKTARKEYEYRLPVPGGVAVPEIGLHLCARLITVQEAEKTAFQGYNQPQLLNPQCLRGELIVRNWRYGDRFWPAHTKSPKKVKELLQKKTEAERKSWPVIISGGEIVWMRGFPLPASFSLPANADASTPGLFIEESETVNE